jgi:hypothetical protein
MARCPPSIACQDRPRLATAATDEPIVTELLPLDKIVAQADEYHAAIMAAERVAQAHAELDSRLDLARAADLGSHAQAAGGPMERVERS